MRKPYLFAAGVFLLLAGSATASNRPDRAIEGGGGPGIASGVLNVETVNGCYLVLTGTVTTNPVGGAVPAGINFWDDGTFIAGIPLTFPGDGGTHPYVASYQVTAPILQGAAGIGIYLEDLAGATATTTFDSESSYNDVTEVCTGPAPDISGFGATSIPTLGQVGLAVLVGLLALAAVTVMLRRRAAARG